MIHIYSGYKKNEFWNYSYEENRPLLKGEYSSDNKLIKPDLVDGVLVETITQSEIDEQLETETNQNLLNEAKQDDQNAYNLAIQIFSYVRKHTGLTTNQKTILKGFAILLKQGDIEQAKSDFYAITRPTSENKMQKVYDKLKIEFDKL